MSVNMPRVPALQSPSKMMMMMQNQDPHTVLPRDTETAPQKTQAQMVSSDLAPGSGAKFSFYPVSNQELRQAEQRKRELLRHNAALRAELAEAQAEFAETSFPRRKCT